MDEDWKEDEFSTLYLGDERIDERAKKILADFGKSPGAPISQAFKGWAEIKACKNIATALFLFRRNNLNHSPWYSAEGISLGYIINNG